jgi:hypothetical protein
MKKVFIFLPVLFVLFSFSHAQNTGIGTTNPVHARLEINGSVGAAVAMFGADKYGLTIEADNPEIGFNYYYNNGTKTIKAGYAAVLGMSPASGDLYIGNFNGSQSVNDFGDINISSFRQRMIIRQNGNIGIGAPNPGFPLTIQSLSDGTGIIQESPDATAQVGFWTATNGAYVQTWTNTELNFTTGNGVSRMLLKTDGNVVVYTSVNIGGALTSSRSGSSNLLPIAFGKIGFDGNIIKASSNVSVTVVQPGNVRLTISGETNMTVNGNKYIIMVTPEASGSGATSYMGHGFIQAGNVVEISTYTPAIGYSNNNCNCNLFSRIESFTASALAACNFSFVIYKNN